MAKMYSKRSFLGKDVIIVSLWIFLEFSSISRKILFKNFLTIFSHFSNYFNFLEFSNEFSDFSIF